MREVLLVSTQECHRCERDTHDESDLVGDAGLPRPEWGGGQIFRGGEEVGDVFGAYGRCGLVKA